MEQIHNECGIKFCFANKYVSHKCPKDSDHKKAAKERFDEIRDGLKAAIDRAIDARTYQTWDRKRNGN